LHREARRRLPAQRGLPRRLRDERRGRDPARPLPRLVRAGRALDPRRGLPARARAVRHQQPLQARASHPRGRLEQRLARLRSEPESRRADPAARSAPGRGGEHDPPLVRAALVRRAADRAGTGPVSGVTTAIVGGGIMGATTLWELARAGMPAALYESGRFGGESTGKSAAIVRMHYSNPEVVRMAV